MNKAALVGAALTCISIITPVFAQESDIEPDNNWESNLDFGLSLSKGNTDNLLLRVALQTEKKHGANAYFGSASYKYGEEDTASNQDELLAEASWKHAFSGKNFFGLRADARRDTFADIDYRFSFNTTYGYYWIDSDTMLFSTELGIGITSEDKGLGNTTYLNGLVAQFFEYQLNPNAKFYQSLSFSPRLDNLEDYRIDFEMGIETKITDSIAFKVSFEDRYESIPALGKDKNDLKLITGISYNF